MGGNGMGDWIVDGLLVVFLIVFVALTLAPVLVEGDPECCSSLPDSSPDAPSA
jgi:hypothetical protein